MVAPRAALERLRRQVLRERARAVVEDEEERLWLQHVVVVELRLRRRARLVERQEALQVLIIAYGLSRFSHQKYFCNLFWGMQISNFHD